MATPLGATGQAVGASANFLPTAQPLETHEDESNTTNLNSARQEKLTAMEFLRGAADKVIVIGVAALAFATAACQPASAENQPGPSSPPSATAEVPTSKYEHTWMEDPGEVAGNTPNEVIQSWCARLEWALNNPKTKNDNNQTGSDVLPQLVDTSTRSGNSTYQYEYRKQMIDLQNRRLDYSQGIFPPDQAYRMTCELLGPVRYKNPEANGFSEVKEFAIHMKTQLGWQRDEGAPVTQEMLNTVIAWDEGLFTFRLNNYIDPATGEKKQIWQLEQIHGNLSTDPFVY